MNHRCVKYACASSLCFTDRYTDEYILDTPLYEAEEGPVRPFTISLLMIVAHDPVRSKIRLSTDRAEAQTVQQMGE